MLHNLNTGLIAGGTAIFGMGFAGAASFVVTIVGFEDSRGREMTTAVSHSFDDRTTHDVARGQSK